MTIYRHEKKPKTATTRTVNRSVRQLMTTFPNGTVSVASRYSTIKRKPTRQQVSNGLHRYSTDPAPEDSTIPYPTDVLSRARFILPDGKKVTPFQWKVYDHILKIPVGNVTTYGYVAKAIGSGAQAVGNALRANPFHPQVPCHRIISSDLFIGGYMGEISDGQLLLAKERKKSDLLRAEGVRFDGNGILKGGQEQVWLGY